MTQMRKNTAPIGAEQVRNARQLLRKYKEGKANLEQKVIEN